MYLQKGVDDCCCLPVAYIKRLSPFAFLSNAVWFPNVTISISRKGMALTEYIRLSSTSYPLVDLVLLFLFHVELSLYNDINTVAS